jgi:hypothetical protein
MERDSVIKLLSDQIGTEACEKSDALLDHPSTYDAFGWFVLLDKRLVLY